MDLCQHNTYIDVLFLRVFHKNMKIRMCQKYRKDSGFVLFDKYENKEHLNFSKRKQFQILLPFRERTISR
jgi:hypothetical protein